MTVREFYAAVDGDYESAVKCFGDDFAIKKWLLRLSADPCFQELQAAMPNGDAEGIAKASNALKGMALNLGLTKLGEASRKLEQTAHSGITMETLSIFRTIEVEYAALALSIEKMLSHKP